MRNSISAALFAALIAVSCFIAIPAGALGVPIVLQNMMVILTGLLLGGVRGAAAVGLFIILGALGLPIFSGGRGGLAVLLGPTGGFIAGYFFGALAAGLIAGKPAISKKSFQYIRIAVAAIIGFTLIYCFGTVRIMYLIMQKQSMSIISAFERALPMAVLPFTVGDLLKLIVLIPLSIKLRPIAARYINK
ncbi:MAG: biotin transporter BioY [Elusimicrobiota bacterium]|jgi:biotin transport system substrate-specific component|nr:biotin transporter BioY [Elusimicrobiota bacterium]